MDVYDFKVNAPAPEPRKAGVLAPGYDFEEQETAAWQEYR